jgi:chromosome segregation protein
LAKAERAIGILVASLPLEIPDATPMVTRLTGETASAKRALGRVFLAPSTQMAAELAAKYPKAIFVAPDASVAFGPVMAKAAPHGEDASAVSVAEGELASVERDLQELRSKRTEVVGRLNSHDADIAAATERLASVERETHALERELAAIEEAASERSRAKSQTITRLESLREQKPQLDSDQAQMEAAVEEAQQAHARSMAELEVAESKAYKVRLELVSMREKKRLLQERESSLESSITTAKGDLEGLDRRRASLETAAEAAAEVHRVSQVLKAGASSWGEEAEVAYQEARSQLTEVEAKIEEMRPTRSELAGELDDLRRRSREEDLGRTELRVNARVIEEKMRNEWNLDPKEAVALYGHVWEVEDLSRITDPIGKVAVLDPKALAAKEARLERDLEKMGRVNPLADQEFRSLTEREEFLAGQIADVRRSRRHLLKVVTEVDQEIKELFADAFRDASVEYERLFSMLFPGGQGRMRLVDPSDLLTSGVEVEARPGGKNLKRLSLLSGGEKALSALAFLFAIFRARPSPFYVLDEVEAALDDVNLHRFLALIREFRGSSQLLVVTHQKRTMEAADVLYGISIKPDGASRVISERLSDVSPAAYEVNGRRSRSAKELPGS